MALSITKNYDDFTLLTAAHLNAAFASVTTWANTTKLTSADHIQDSGIATENLADSCVSTSKLAGSITSAAFAEMSTAKFDDNAVTRAKREAVNYALSSSSDSANFSFTTDWTDGPNLTVSLTTTGRPVILMLVPIILGSSTCSFTSIFYRFAIDGIGLGDCQGFTSGGVPGLYKQAVHPDAGTYTFSLQYKGNSTAFRFVKLLAYEL